jgi:hypothetical protein
MYLPVEADDTYNRNMFASRRTRLSLIFLGAVTFLLAVEGVASACPTCKETLAANDPNRENLVRGYFYSILFMLSMPFLIFTSLCGYFYYEVCKARRLKKNVADAPSVGGMMAKAR